MGRGRQGTVKEELCGFRLFTEDENHNQWDPASQYVYVCGKHFITGYNVNDGEHPDYVPSIFPRRPSSEGSKRLKRYQRRDAVSQHEVLPAKRQRIKPPTEASPTETPEDFDTAYPEAPLTEDSLPQPSDDMN
ncbi:hypothetical protein NQZ68_001071 [Dissostichus eleginoides]|nr:hypothetical protein NQZ68_001071 [Dissostichus eleginoides]